MGLVEVSVIVIWKGSVWGNGREENSLPCAAPIISKFILAQALSSA